MFLHIHSFVAQILTQSNPDMMKEFSHTPSTRSDKAALALPGISVIIPAYNYAEYLPQAIESVLAQDYPQFEVIVVDDGSTDATPDIIRRYGNKIRSIHQENQGLSAARNTGIQAAKHPYLAFLDADDMWRPGLLLTLALALQTLPPETGLVACQSRVIDASGRTIKSNPPPSPDTSCREIFWQDILLKTRFGSSGLLVARNCFENCGLFDTTLRSSEDRDMWLRIAEHFRLFLVPDDLAMVRRHDRNMSADPWRMKNSMLRVINAAWNRAQGPICSRPAKAKVLAYCYYETAWMHYDARQHRQAILDILHSLVLYPLPINRGNVGQPHLFRLRALTRFIRSFR